MDHGPPDSSSASCCVRFNPFEELVDAGMVVVVCVVVVVHTLHINGHARCTLSRSPKDKHSHNPTNVVHMSKSSQVPTVKVVVVVVQ